MLNLSLFLILLGLAVSLGRSLPRDHGPRPVLSQYTAVEGKVICPGLGPGCSGATRAILKAWWQFDDAGEVLNYREDCLLGDGMNIVYNREYSTPSLTREYMLASSSATELMCFSMNWTFTPFNRNFPKAVFQREGIYSDTPVWVWTDVWHMVPYGALNASLYINQETRMFSFC